LTAFIERRNLTAPVALGLFERLFDGEIDEQDAAALLIGLRMKGESADELAAAARSLRERMIPFDAGSRDVLDTCGTGGDGAGTFNVSTAVAFVVAAAGVPVVKHGNRAVSGRSGSSDVLTELGLPAEAGPQWSKRCFEETGLAFCFAPHFHPALSRLAPLRRRLGVRTILNNLGPLANPAGAAFQLIGVGRPEMLDSLAGALATLGTRHALVVSGIDGFDEVSLTGTTLVRDIRGSTITAEEWSPADFGTEPCRPQDLQASDAATSAALIRDVLKDQPGPARRLVLVNAAAALLAADRVPTLRDGLTLADATIRTGAAHRLLDRLRTVGVFPAANNDTAKT
jgi:anthranilate phosphoribosyltransferase